MKVYVSKEGAYYKPRCIMVKGKYGKDAIAYSEGWRFGTRTFFDDRHFIMENAEFEANFEPMEGNSNGRD